MNGGKQTRSFTYIDDGINALIKIICNENKNLNQKIFNIGSPQNNTSIEKLAELVIQEYSKIAPSKYTGKVIHKTSNNFYGSGYEDIPVRIPDIKEAKKFLDWDPIVGIEEAISKTLAYFVDSFEKSKLNK